MTPEQLARQKIDKKLIQAGWLVQDYNHFNPSAGLGIAVCEYPVETGKVDYLLFIDRKPIGVIEAKKEGVTLSGVHEQTVRYADGKLKHIINKETIPFRYESTGVETYFTDTRDPFPRQREIFHFHKPETLEELNKQEDSLRKRLQSLPTLPTNGLRLCQTEAIINLEKSFASNRPRAVIQMATGAGKTFTAITSVYRLLKYAKAKRILFLVDTRNLGKQAEQEFRAFKPNDDKRLFPELYNVQRLQSNFIDMKGQACISTIQRMYSILKGEELDESLEDEPLYKLDPKMTSFGKMSSLNKEVAYNPAVPIESFDFVIIDECHRSIYNLWKQVLDYFDAFMIGLTATPDKRTYAFFNENLVSHYAHKQAVADNVNVDYDVYTIETDITQKGAILNAKEYVDFRNKMTREKQWTLLEDEVIYEGRQLDRDVVNPSQIRNIIKTYREKLKTDIFPERDEVPKTLIFAKTDSHAEDIVKIAREEFDEGNDFCKKITYNVKNEDPESFLQQFRTGYYPRIAVTVDMIATGTDVKPIEALIFMRDVRSRNYFQQMVGRGTRTLNKDDLVKVTPSAKTNKSRFVIVDAVGVFKTMKIDYPAVDNKPTVPLKDLMKMAIFERDEDTLTSLASRLTRLDKQVTEKDREKFKELSGGKTLSDVVKNLMNAHDPDKLTETAKQKFNLPTDTEPNEEQLKQAADELSLNAVKPFDKPELRDFIETVRQKIYQVIDNTNIDKVTFAGYDKDAKEKAEEIINNFRKFIDENKDEIIALRILYNRRGGIHSALTFNALEGLRDALNMSPYYLTPEVIWNAYRRFYPQKVKGTTAVRILTDIICLIRFELSIYKELEPREEIVNRLFKDWIFRKNAGPKQFTEEQMEWLRMIKDHIITSVRIEKEDFGYTPFNDRGGLGKFWKLFGEKTDEIIKELNKELAA
ncbi:MAG: type I restriction-modification enzyme R subunit C-terminal domain-containing protein [Ignavibacteria bacterium]|nr:type I restriction-modification enzyme R subunit C-terminal domain-containing protein [Ignavibacteria bacterium]